MTGYESKKAAAQDKLLDDDDTQVYQNHDDALTIAYQSGFYDGKKAAAQEPTKYSFRAHWEEDGCIGVVAAIERLDGGVHLLKDIIDAPQPAQEPWRESASDYERGVIDGRQMQAQSSVDKAVNAMTQPAQEPVTWAGVDFDINTAPPQRSWVGLTDEDRQAAFESMPNMLEGFLKTWGWLHFAKALEQIIKDKNNGTTP
jgi:hypothetical protein